MIISPTTSTTHLDVVLKYNHHNISPCTFHYDGKCKCAAVFKDDHIFAYLQYPHRYSPLKCFWNMADCASPWLQCRSPWVRMGTRSRAGWRRPPTHTTPCEGTTGRGSGIEQTRRRRRRKQEKGWELVRLKKRQYSRKSASIIALFSVEENPF